MDSEIRVFDVIEQSDGGTSAVLLDYVMGVAHLWSPSFGGVDFDAGFGAGIVSFI